MKHIMFLLIGLFLINTMVAQERREEIRDKIENHKIAYLSTKLELTPETSQEFWPLYNAYQNEMRAIQDSYRSVLEGESTKEDPNKLLDNMIRNESEILAIKKQYLEKMRNVIGPEKTLQFFRFDREFKEQMLREIGERREHMRGKSMGRGKGMGKG